MTKATLESDMERVDTQNSGYGARHCQVERGIFLSKTVFSHIMSDLNKPAIDIGNGKCDAASNKAC